MELTTFGAVMKFSLEILDRATCLHKIISSLTEEPALKATIESLLEESERNKSFLERVRRENVTEMILEPVTGLLDRDFPAEIRVEEHSDAQDLLASAIAIETGQKNFFAAVSANIPYPEVRRAFQKICQKKESAIETLRSLKI